MLDQAHYRGAAFRIRNGGYVALWLVHQQIDVAFRAMQELAIHFDVVAIKISLGAEFGDDLAIHGDAALRDQLFGFAARSYACGGDDFL
jgi:hypothetical protein